MNGHGPHEVGILFSERLIARLFAELITAHGAAAKVLQEISELPPDSKLVTEIQYYHQLAPAQQAHCLVVGPPRQLTGISCPTLPQPLTEEGIESALQQFLG